MVDLSNIPQFDSGILDSPADRSDVNDKKLRSTGNTKIDNYLNSKFNKRVNAIANNIGNLIFNPKRKFNYVIKGADILTDGSLSKNADVAIEQLKTVGDNAYKEVLSHANRLKNAFTKKFGITFTRDMDTSKLSSEAKAAVDEINDAYDYTLAIRAGYNKEVLETSREIKKVKTPLVKELDKEIDKAMNWKTTFSNLYPGMKQTRQTSKKVSQLPGIGSTTPSGAAKVYQFTYKGLANKHGGNKKLDEIIRNKKHPKHQEVMDTFNDAIRKYSRQMDELFQYRDDMLESYADDLIEVYTKYGDDAGQGVIDFAHKFPVSQTARMNPASELLDKAGNPEYLYLSPSFVNRKVQVFFDDLAENVMKGKPLSYGNRPLATQGYRTGTRRVDAFDNMTMNLGEGVSTSPAQFDEFLELGKQSKNYDAVNKILAKIDDGLRNVKAQSSYSIYNPKAIAAQKTGSDTINLTLGKNLETKSDMKELLQYLLDPSVTKDTLIAPFQEGGQFADGEPTNSVGAIQSFMEEGVGDEVAGSRFLGTLFKGKLFDPVSSGFGKKYDARNLPILKDADPITQGIWNTVAPYGEKGFDILDTFVRLPAATWADIAKAAGSDENQVNKLQAEINTMMMLPIASSVNNLGAISRIKKVNNIANAARKVDDKVEDATDVTKQIIAFPKTKPAELGFNSRYNPNTNKIELYDGTNLIGSHNSLDGLAKQATELNKIKWSGKNYKRSQVKEAFTIMDTETGGYIATPEGDDFYTFTSRDKAEKFLDGLVKEGGMSPTNIEVTKIKSQKPEKTGDFSRYSMMMESIANKYSPNTTKTGNQWYGELKNAGHAKELDKSGFGFFLIQNPDKKFTAADLWNQRALRGTQINPDHVSLKGPAVNLKPEFENIMTQYNNAQDFTLASATNSKYGGLGKNLATSIDKQLKGFATYVNNALGESGKLTTKQADIIDSKADDLMANIVMQIEKAQGRPNYTDDLIYTRNTPNYPLEVYQASEVLSKTGFGSEVRNAITRIKNLKRDYGTTSEHKSILLPNDAARNTQNIDVYTYDPLKGQVNYRDAGINAHFEVPHQWAHVRSTERETVSGLRGTHLDEIQYDILKGIDRNGKVYKPDTMFTQKQTYNDQVKVLEQQASRIFNNELKKLLVKSDLDDPTDYMAMENQRQLNEKARTIPDDDPTLADIRQRVLADHGSPQGYMNAIGNKAYDKIQKQIDRMNKEFEEINSANMPDVPWRDRIDATAEIFKHQIERAIKAGHDFVAVPYPEQVLIYENQVGNTNTAVAFNNIYRKNALPAIQKIQKDYADRLAELNLEGKTFDIKVGDEVDQFFSWKPAEDSNFTSGRNELYRRYKLDDPQILEMIAAGNYKEPVQPFPFGKMPGNKIATKPYIYIDLRNLNGFDRKQLAKVGFREYKEGGSTKINQYSALASINLGVAV